MKPTRVLIFFLALMAGMIGAAFLFQEAFTAFLKHPALYSHARFLHIAASALFFSHAVIGIMWEQHSLADGSKEIVLHTYRTVAFLDARFSSPLIIISVLGGLSLSLSIGGLWETGWLSVSFLLFLVSGVLWIVFDIPTQYKIMQLSSGLTPEDRSLPDELVRLLKRRRWISLAGVVPLMIIFILMVYKPDIQAVADWFGS